LSEILLEMYFIIEYNIKRLEILCLILIFLTFISIFLTDFTSKIIVFLFFLITLTLFGIIFIQNSENIDFLLHLMNSDENFEGYLSDGGKNVFKIEFKMIFLKIMGFFLLFVNIFFLIIDLSKN
jgi:hypothetical protein